MNALALMISDRASAGVYADTVGPEILSALRKRFPDTAIERAVVPDDRDRIVDFYRRSDEYLSFTHVVNIHCPIILLASAYQRRPNRVL